MKSAAYIATHIRRVLQDGASAPHSEEVQRFFKEEIASRGWYTAELRKLAVRFRRQLLAEAGAERVLAVAEQLFRGRVLEEKVLAVFLLQSLVKKLGEREFKLFESWLDRVSSWADHDALVSYLIGPLMAAEPARAERVFRWARSRDRWHRRAAAVSLIRGAREKMFLGEIKRLTELLLADQDDMVQKGLGWLLRETAKFNPEATVPFLMSIRERAPRLVLRTACETLPAETRARVLGRGESLAQYA
jgi:3-methyladenine DNA glycosylase AlkD